MGLSVLILLVGAVGAYIIANPKLGSLSPGAMKNRRLHAQDGDTKQEGNKEPFKLMELPYGLGDLAPQISEETVQFHYLKHHAGYVKRLNELALKDPDIAKKSLDELVQTAQGTIYNMAAQIWNHDFYWLGLSPESNVEHAPKTMEIIDKTFGSLTELKKKINASASAHFGSGWVWLLYDKPTDSLQIVATKDAGNPVRTLLGRPLLVLDVWEHAYYIDYRNDKARYTDAWFEKVNWKRVEQLLEQYRQQ